ncbi:hypothetical protein [Rhodococcus qingshengii]|uniref:hypothetical protein n=1 Tax=Rhodococcus qingshengii TaxID=334542 RepID=UPI0030D18D74
MEFEHLGYGWMSQNIDRSGTGFGVIARSAGWDKKIGTIGRELGGLISRPADENSTFEIATHRGFRLLVRKSAVKNSRQGSYFVHLVDPAELPMPDCIDLLRAGLLFSSPEQFPDQLPTPSARPLTVDMPSVNRPLNLHDAPSETLLAGVGAAVLANLADSTKKYALVGVSLPDLTALLGETARILPLAISSRIRFIATTGDLAGVNESETRLVCAETYEHKTGVDYVVIDLSIPVESSGRALQPYASIMQRAIAWTSEGGVVAPHLANVDQLSDWLSTRELMLQPVAELSTAQLSTVLSMGHESLEWLDRPGNFEACVERAVQDERILRLLVRLPDKELLQGYASIIAGVVFKMDLSGDTRDHILQSLSVDRDQYSVEAIEVFWSHWQSEMTLSANQESTIYPLLAADNVWADQRNRQTLDVLLESVSFREYAAFGTEEVAIRMLTLEFEKPSKRRDYQALSALARYRPDAIVAFLAERGLGHDPLDHMWAVDALDLTHCINLLSGLSANPTVPPQTVFDSIAQSTRPEIERRELLRQVWPLLQQSMGIPSQLRDWLVVEMSPTPAKPVNNLATVPPLNSSRSGFDSQATQVMRRQSRESEARTGVMQRIRQAFGLSD